jgi:hypothetical protein
MISLLTNSKYVSGLFSASFFAKFYHFTASYFFTANGHFSRPLWSYLAENSAIWQQLKITFSSSPSERIRKAF